MSVKKKTSSVPLDKMTLFEGDGTLYMRRNNSYASLGPDGDFTIELLAEEEKGGVCRYWIIVSEGEESVLCQSIGNGMTISYSPSDYSVHWPAIIDAKYETLAFKFDDADAKMTAETIMMRFVEMYNRCTYALMTGSQVQTDDAKEDEFFDYLGGISTAQLPDEDYNEPMYALDVALEHSKNTGAGNVCYSESMRHNRAIVVRESRKAVELQAHAMDNDRFANKSPELITLSGFDTCDGALLDDTERKMLLHSAEENRLRHVDLEYGKVVQEFQPSSDFPVRAVTYSAHVPSSSPVYTCLSDKASYNVDLRLDQKKAIDIESGRSVVDYALGSLRKPFTCHATTAAGHLVIGDSVGGVRLYTGPPGSRRSDGTRNPKTAKTLLETKVPIVAVDVTADGEWVVAVCSKYLLLMRTTFKDEGKNTNTNGFRVRMGEKKPLPLKLQPTVSQLAALGGADALNFTVGRFDRFEGADGKEVCITACSGKFIFTWSLDAAVRAEETGRACLGESALVRKEVIGLSSSNPGRVMYLTEQDIRIAPLKRHEHVEKGTNAFTYLKSKPK